MKNEVLVEGLSLVIPAHNAEKLIEKSIEDYSNAFSKKFQKFEIIVVCNDCWDKTSDICIRLSKKYPLSVLEISERGKGYALRAGFNKAKYGIVGFLDADNPFDLSKIVKMLDHLANKEVVIVSKYLRGKIRKQDYLVRRLVSFAGGFFSNVILGLKFRDTQAGAKFFKKSVWKKISGNDFICTGFDWDLEFLYRASRLNLSIAEVYVPCKSEKFSTFRLKYIPGMVWRLIKLRFLKRIRSRK